MPLAVYLEPLPDELLSSWIIRTCHANATSLYSLLWHFKLNNHAQIDLDQTQDTPLLNWVAETLKHPEGFKGVRAMSLTPIHDLEVLFPHKSWIKGIDRRAFKWRSFRYCPQCLITDPEPYFRRHWRLEWHEICPQHHVKMPNGCQECGAPIILHRIPWKKNHLAHCQSCSQDFRHSFSSQIQISLPQLDAIAGLYSLISDNNTESYAAVHFLEAFIEQGQRLRGVEEPINALKSIGINIDLNLAKTFPSFFLATSAYQLWSQKRDLLDDFIFQHQGWFNLAARDYSCPDVLKTFHRTKFRYHELNQSIIDKATQELTSEGVEPTSARIARKIGCHINRVRRLRNPY